MSEKIKLDDKIVKDHVSDWSYETKDDLGNKVIKQKVLFKNILSAEKDPQEPKGIY